MLAAGMSILSLQRYLGHEDLNTTLMYAEASDPMLQKDYYRGAATFDPASAELARRVMDLSQRDELRQPMLSSAAWRAKVINVAQGPRRPAPAETHKPRVSINSPQHSRRR